MERHTDMYAQKSTNGRLSLPLPQQIASWSSVLNQVASIAGAFALGLLAAALVSVVSARLSPETGTRFMAAWIGVPCWLYVAIAFESRTLREAALSLMFALATFGVAVMASGPLILAAGFLLHGAFGVWRMSTADQASSRYAALAWTTLYTALAIQLLVG